MDNMQNGKPTYALEHLATFKVKNDAEMKNPKEKMKLLLELDKTGNIWPQKMYMSFSGQWLVMLDNDMKEIENFPGTLIKEPTAFISEDPAESFNNILIFTVPGVTLGNTEMHIFQVSDVSAVHLVEDLKQLSSGKIITTDRHKSTVQDFKQVNRTKLARDQYGIAAEVAGIGQEKDVVDHEQIERDIDVLNHCFEDSERFIARLQYAAEAIRELDGRQNEHSAHGEGLLMVRSRPPTEKEFQDIFAKFKLALNYIVKLQKKFSNPKEPIDNLFVSLEIVVNTCNDVYIGVNVAENVINPLLRRDTVLFLSTYLNFKQTEFWYSLGENWTVPKEHFKNIKGSFHPIFYDDWSPDWVVDEEVNYIPLQTMLSTTSSKNMNDTWLSRLQSRNVKIAEVVFDKSANNDKELSVAQGEYLEIIDDSRKWWKVRNSKGNIGYVPQTILSAYNFEHSSTYKDNDSISSSTLENDVIYAQSKRNTLAINGANEIMPQTAASNKGMPRSYSMPNPPIPPPLPPPESAPSTPNGTLQRNLAAAGAMAAMRARNDCDSDGVFLLQSTINDELKYTLLQREKRKDLEILKTPEIFIDQSSKPSEVEKWLRGKGFSDVIVAKLGGLTGAEIFDLKPHVIENYFGKQESRRLISQIVLQKNICEYKSIRSSELSAKLAKARQKADEKATDPNEIF